MSTHRAEVVKVVLEPHPNADSLSLVRLWNYVVVVKTAEWQGVDRGVYVVPDSVVPYDKAFEFLAAGPPVSENGPKTLREKDRRITARKFRGVMSEGLLMRLPALGLGRVPIGTDVASAVGITRWEPPVKTDTTVYGRGRGLHHLDNMAGPPSNIAPIYDVESWQRYGRETFEDGEPIVITEKVDGTNFRMCFLADKRERVLRAYGGANSVSDPLPQGTLYVGSHRTWKRKFQPVPYRPWYVRALEFVGLRTAPQPRESTDFYWRTVRKYPKLRALAEVLPDHTIYGEVYGKVPNGNPAMTYGHQDDEISFALFDIRKPDGTYMNGFSVASFGAAYSIPIVPVLYVGPYSEDVVRAHMSGKSLMSTPQGQPVKHIREGIVIRSKDEVRTSTGARKLLKAVSPLYLEKC